MKAAADPVPGSGARRPRNRRASIIAVASELFRAHGYEHVSMSQIAAAVDVRPSALYRHFAGKQQLLAQVVWEGLAPVEAVVDKVDLREGVSALSTLAEFALDQPSLGVLWLREVRHLAPEDQKASAAAIRSFALKLSVKCRQARPDLTTLGADLLAWSLVGALVSTSFHSIGVARERYSALLEQLLGRIVGAPVPAHFTEAVSTQESPAGLEPYSRRQALLVHATRLFAQRRYAGVGIEDVGASLEMSGPGVYNHFSSKSDLLGLALTRGAAYLHLQAAEVLSTANNPADGLSGLVASYTRFAATHSDLGAILVTETRNLTETYQQDVLNAQRDYIDEWTHLLQQVPHGHDAVAARLTVHAALMLINVATQVNRLRTASHSVDTIAGVVVYMFGITPECTA